MYGSILAGMSILIQSCEQPFEPLVENDRYHFTIHGVLDASADTQWVRVMPVRDSIFTSPKPLGADVSITRLSTGEKITLEDSLFELRQGYYAWNYWTDEDILPDEDYLFAAVNQEGDSSTVHIQVPPEFPPPIVIYGGNSPIGQIFIEGIENIAVVDIIFYFHVFSNGTSSPLIKQGYSQLDDIRESADGTQVVYAYPGEGKRRIGEQYRGGDMTVVHEKQELLIVSGGPGWPDTEGLSEPERFLPGAISNVRNGLGVLPGAVSMVLPFKGCFDEEGERVSCEPLKSKPLLDLDK